MKFSNFNATKVLLISTALPLVDTVYGTVDIITGFLWWKKTETKEVAAGIGGIVWYFPDTGDITPAFEVERLARAYKYRWLNGEWKNHPRTEFKST